MKPWGTPALTFSHAYFWPLRTTLCFLWLKMSDKRSGWLPDIPFCDSLNISPLCYILSKALKISRKTLLTSNLSSNVWKISCVMDNGWLVQESPGLNPDWFSERRFSSKTLNISLKINLSKISPQIGSNETGW